MFINWFSISECRPKISLERFARVHLFLLQWDRSRHFTRHQAHERRAQQQTRYFEYRRRRWPTTASGAARPSVHLVYEDDVPTRLVQDSPVATSQFRSAANRENVDSENSDQKLGRNPKMGLQAMLSVRGRMCKRISRSFISFQSQKYVRLQTTWIKILKRQWSQNR